MSYKLLLRKLDDADIRLLKVFDAVVANSGFSAARNDLNLDQSTISSYISQLETRLGFRLCERGRNGFKLTEEGEKVYASTLKLFAALDQFSFEVKEYKEDILSVGDINLGIVDSLSTCQNFNLSKLLKKAYDKTNINVNITINCPRELLKMLENNELDVIVSPIYNPSSSIDSFFLVKEHHVFCCAKEHPVLQYSDADLTCEVLSQYNKVTTNFSCLKNFKKDDYKKVIFSPRVEGAAILILSGDYIGYLPQHYARQWLDTGEMKQLPIGKDRVVELRLAYRKNSKSKSLTRFIELVKSYKSSKMGHDICSFAKSK